MIDWQPIETAPKDGTRVLLWCVPEIHGLRQNAVCGKWVWGGWSTEWDLPSRITHWAPLNPPEGA